MRSYNASCLAVLLFLAFAQWAALYAQEPQPPLNTSFRMMEYNNAVRRYTDRTTSKIYHGAFAADGSHPWQVSLGVAWIADPKDGHFCGGAVYDEKWIVTAAHCLYFCDAISSETCESNPKKLSILNEDRIVIAAGTNRLQQGIVRQNVSKLFIHKAFSIANMDNDIALLQLRDSMKVGEKIKSIPVVQAADEPKLLKVPRVLTITGWGATSATEEDNQVVLRRLQEGHVSYVPNTGCGDPLTKGPFPTTTNMICAGKSKTAIGDACGGDSGGPVIVDAKTANAMQVGIVSWGGDCGSGNFGRYTRLANYAAWLAQCTSSPETCPALKR